MQSGSSFDLEAAADRWVGVGTICIFYEFIIIPIRLFFPEEQSQNLGEVT